MSRIPVIRIKYCGGCNPEMDRSRTVAELMEYLEDEAQWTHDPGTEADILLHVCGCAHACPDEESTVRNPGIPIVSIQGLRVNRREVNPGDLASAAAEKIREALEIFFRNS